MIRLLDYINKEIKEHIDSGYEVDYDKVHYEEDTEKCLSKMYDVGKYDTLLQFKRLIEELIKDGK